MSTQPLTRSYTQHKHVSATYHDKSFIVGIDEAGRGPVLGKYRNM
jgi:hypothetical protein